jgi:hypothetical protein
MRKEGRYFIYKEKRHLTREHVGDKALYKIEAPADASADMTAIKDSKNE